MGSSFFVCLFVIYYFAKEYNKTILKHTMKTFSLLLCIGMVTINMQAQENPKDSLSRSEIRNTSRVVSVSNASPAGKGVVDWHQYLLAPGFDIGLSDNLSFRVNSMLVYAMAGAEINYSFLRQLDFVNIELGYWGAYDYFLNQKSVSHGPVFRFAVHSQKLLFTSSVMIPVNFNDYNKYPFFSLAFQAPVGKKVSILCEYSRIERHNSRLADDTGTGEAQSHDFIYAGRFYRPKGNWIVGISLLLGEKYNNTAVTRFVVPFVAYNRRIAGN